MVSAVVGSRAEMAAVGARRSRRLMIVLAINLLVVIGQVTAGLAGHSLGLLADAGHNLTDVVAVVLSLVAVRLTRRPATAARSYGYHRSSVLAAQANAALIIAMAMIIGFEGFRRLNHPHPVSGGLVVAVALGALLANAAAAALLHERGGHDLNMRSALLHMAGDALASGGVAIAGAVIAFTGGWYLLDPLVSIGVAALIAVQAVRLVRDAADVLLESTPSGLDMARLTTTMSGVSGVEDVHDVHAWSLSSEVRALSAHVVLSGHPTLEQAQVVGEAVKAAIAGPFAIAHATLELECETCVDGDIDPCTMDELSPAARSHRH
jgi:cobalt-zinc-cadmium efflux system protein